LNVLLGDMSLVGPRPEVPEYRPFYQGAWKRVLEVKPGITDFASLKYRQEDKLLRETQDPEWSYRNEILPDKLRINLEYTRNIRIENDLKILWETFLRLFLSRKQWGDSRQHGADR
jgi:lipopolysaccharide/colanic/teichoic acid biosynthesis glycosyltransferase